MSRLVVAVLIVAVVAGVAWFLERRRGDAPTQGGWSVPAQLDRDDFARPDAAWLVAVFTSATCDSCRDVVAKALVLASDDVAVEEVEAAARKDLHGRYGIDAVPTIVLADATGTVRRSFVGPVTATDLWAALAELRGDASS